MPATRAEKPIRFYLHMSEHFDVHFAAQAFREYTGIELKLSHGVYWGGWHGSSSTDECSLELFMNPYNVGHGVEYHRPETPTALVLISFNCTLNRFRFFESRLADASGVFLLSTGWEKNLPADHRFRTAAAA